MRPTFQKLRSLSRELQRRRVYRVAALYLACGFALLQGADLVMAAVSLPGWVFPLLVVLVAVGFPLAVALAWAFQHTAEGLRQEAGHPGLRGWVARGIVVGIAITVSGGLGWSGWALWVRPVPAAGEERTGSTPDPARIAVLYFDDHSPGRDLGYLADGLTEGLLHELAQVPALEVISRNAVKAHRRGDLSLDSLVGSLRIGSLVEGSVSRSGDRVRVAVQLVDAASGAHLDSRMLERPHGELFALETELAQEVARLLRQRLGAEIRLREWRSGASSVEAWTLLQRVAELQDEYRHIWKRDPEAGVRGLLAADSLLRVAEGLDPDWVQIAVARGWLAYHLSLRQADVPGHLDELWSRRSLGHADRATALRPDNAAGHELRGVVLGGLYLSGAEPATARQAEAALRRAVDLDPRAAWAWSMLSRILFEETRFAEARYAARQALEADAFLEDGPTVMLTLYESALKEGPEEEARRWCEEGRRRFPEDANFVLCRLFILASFPQVEPDLPTAWGLLDTLVVRVSAQNRAPFRALATMQLAKVAARAGLPDSARAILRLVGGDETPDWLAYDEAHLRLLLGQREEAMQLLRIYLEQEPDTAKLARDWWFDGLHGEPRFRALVGL